MQIFEQLVLRIDRLLLRQQELQRTNVLLQEQLAKAVAERDMARTRLHTAGARIDALLAYLAEQTASAEVK